MHDDRGATVVNESLTPEGRLYYLQDKRQMVGNSMMWWRHGHAGYCCDVREAHVFTREEAYAQHRMRPTDVPWPKDYIDASVSHHVDHQRVDRELIDVLEAP